MLKFILCLFAGYSAHAEDALDALMKKYKIEAPTAEAKKADKSAAKGRMPASSTEAKPVHARAHKKAKAAVKTEEKAKDAAPSASAPQGAATPAAPAEEKAEDKYADTLFGDWGGVRRSLESHGVDLSLKYKADWMNNMSGGVKRGSAFLGNVDVIAETDMEKLAGVKGMKIVLYGLGDHGGKPSEMVGDSFVTSNIEAPSTFKLFEAYISQAVDDHMTVVFGMRDLNADYYSSPSAGLFLNSSFGISTTLAQTGVHGPSIFPTTSLALYLKYEGPGNFYSESGVFNATAGDPNSDYGTHLTVDSKNGYLYMWETGFAKDDGDHPFKYGVGVWNYTQPTAALDTTRGDVDNWGGYLLLDQHMTKNVGLFLRHGIAAPAANQFESVTELGVEYKAILPFRPDDALAIGFVNGNVSGPYRAINGSLSREQLVEVVYDIHLGHGLELLPDYQYVIHPGLNPDVKNAQVGTLRLKINF